MTRKRRPARKTKTGGRPDRIAEITLYMTHGPDSLWERSIDRFRDAMADERNGPDPNAFLAVSGWPQARTKELFGTILYKMGQNRDRVPPSADNRRLFPIHTPSEGPAPGTRSGGANIDLLISPKVRPGEAKAIWAWLLDCVVAAVMDTRLAPAIDPADKRRKRPAEISRTAKKHGLQTERDAPDLYNVMDKARAGTATNGHHMNETAIKTDPRTWWIRRFLGLQDDLARCLRIGVDGAPDTQKRRETATGHLAARGCGFHTDVFGPEGAILAMQTTDAARSGERLVLRAWRENDRISWNLDLERPRARRDEEYVETDASRQLGPATAEAADNMADKLLHVMKSDHSNWMLCRNTSLLFQHPGEVERAAQHVLKATTVIQKWIRRGDKPSVQELAEKLAADAGLSLTFAPTDDGGLSQVRIMVEINDRHTLSIDHRATTEIKRSLGFRATTSRTAEHASFNIQRDKSAAEPRWRLNGDSGGRIVLAYLDYLDAKKETGTARDNLANALLAITAHPAVATEQTLRDAFDAEQAEIGRITLGSSAGTGRPPDHQTEDTATPSR